jgi:hypothetical protein
MRRPKKPPTLEELAIAVLDETEIARIDALARHCGITRGQMIDLLVDAGLTSHDNDTTPPASGRQVKRSAS